MFKWLQACLIISPKSLKQDRRVWIRGSGGPKCTVSVERRADSSGQKRKKKTTVKMIFIDWMAAAAVRPHYELKTQVRASGRTSEPIRWSAAKRANSGVQVGEGLATACHPVLDSLCLSSPAIMTRVL